MGAPPSSASHRAEHAAKASPSSTGSHATASPSPTTTGSSSPTGSGTTPPVASPSSTPTSSSGPGGSCVTSAAKGTCGPYADVQIEGTSSNPTVNNNVWSPITGWQQTLYSDNPGDWSVTANMPAGNTQIVSYPSSGSNYNDESLSSFSSIYSSFSENMHPTSGTQAWAAYDIWLNNWGNEVMIHHDLARFNSYDNTPTARDVQFGGSGGVPVQSWDLHQYGSEWVWQPASNSWNEETGSVDILAMLQWMEAKGYLPASSTLTSIGYGFEIASTGGVNENFQVSSYSLSAS
jgi:hypothetical protein